ncbi:Hypothetical protein EPM1_3005 [Stenotrophomonas maltophilia EPM1]|nr:Hypothetical protein EPM1_3005 [Stenotrophomonas maltophilia EPM1]
MMAPPTAHGMGRRSCLRSRQDREPAAGRGPAPKARGRADCQSAALPPHAANPALRAKVD